jgi:hypothetical protein
MYIFILFYGNFSGTGNREMDTNRRGQEHKQTWTQMTGTGAQTDRYGETSRHRRTGTQTDRDTDGQGHKGTRTVIRTQT